MYVEVNCKLGDDWVYRFAKAYRLDKTQIVVSWRAYCKMLSTHWSAIVYLASQNMMNGGTGEKEGRNRRERINRDM